MLKGLARVAVLLMVLPALAPVPGWATSPAGNGGDKNENQGQGNQNAPTPPLPLVNKQVQPVPANPHGSDVAGENAEHSVKLTNVPPITLIDKKKTFWDSFFDWGQWVFAGVLAVVSGLQVWLLIRQEKILRGARKEIHTQARYMSRQADLMNRNNVITLATAKAAQQSAKAAAISADAALAQIQAMKDQASLMGRQTDILETSVAIAKESAAAAEISAKAAMGVAVPTLVLNAFLWEAIRNANREDFLKIPHIRIAVKNYGQSPAFVRAYDVVFTLEELPDNPSYNEPPYSFDSDNIVIDPGAVTLLDAGKVNPGFILSESDIEEIDSAKKTLTIYGYVRYGDVFGSSDKFLRFCQYLEELPTKDRLASFISLNSKQYTGKDDQNPN
jgi:hypothetical protein